MKERTVVSPDPKAQALAAKAIRVLTVDAVAQARSGHVGLPLGCAEIGVVLFSQILRHDPADPGWPDRDRFVLSGGHGSMLLYSLLHLSGYDLPMDEIRRFRQLHSRTPGHPEHGLTPGIETTTGPLGQGFTNAVGMALAERMLAARLGSDLVDHRTYVLASDGDVMEGVGSEAASIAGHLGLGRLIVLYDSNGVTIDGPTSLAFSEDVGGRFDACGWEVQQVDGHDMSAVLGALVRAQEAEHGPHLIICHTHIGFASPAVDTAAAHGTIGEEATTQTRDNLHWKLPPFEAPDEARSAFRPNAERGAGLRRAWEERRVRACRDPRIAELWDALVGRRLPPDLFEQIPDFRGARPLATRQASGRVLNALAPRVPGLVGGSADLSASNNVILANQGVVERSKFEGRNLHFGVREHAMGAIANGVALHGGFRPYVGTFLVFSDYMRPAVRLAALMRQPVVFVFTHDSIFVGEDGPTHQPVEHLAALRTIPGLVLWRPADARETAAAWAAVLERDEGPTALALTRQPVPVLEGEDVERRARYGGYVLVPEAGSKEPELVIVATGSEVTLGVEAVETLRAEGRRVRLVSLPSLAVFQGQEESYREAVLPEGSPRLVVEAGVELGLAPILRTGDRFLGMTGFGVSAPGRDLAQHFGFTVERVVEAARELL
jgi:transketolase